MDDKTPYSIRVATNVAEPEPTTMTLDEMIRSGKVLAYDKVELQKTFKELQLEESRKQTWIMIITLLISIAALILALVS